MSGVRKRAMSRRQLLGAAAGLFPYVVPRRVLGGQGRTGANSRIRIGVIGLGSRGNLLIDQLPQEAEVVAVSDCYLARAHEAVGRRRAQWRVYQDYRQLLDQNDIDAVIEASTEHGRALIDINVCLAGKDLYAEKPLTLYIEEGRQLVRAARRSARVVQVGTQQRSMALNRAACEFVRQGGLGRLHFVLGVNYPGPSLSGPRPEEPVFPGLDWDRWLGQAKMRPFHNDYYYRWMGWRDFSGGEMTNWGAHGLDQIQSALGADHTGPVECWPIEGSADGAVALRYASGVTVRLELPMTQLVGGAMFVGEKGRLEIMRNKVISDPPDLFTAAPPQEEIDKWNRGIWQAKFHMQNWLDCIRSRNQPLADVEIGHRSVTVCHLANLTRQLGRKLRWDPAKEEFVDDTEANRAAKRDRREGYQLPKI